MVGNGRTLIAYALSPGHIGLWYQIVSPEDMLLWGVRCSRLWCNRTSWDHTDMLPFLVEHLFPQ